MTSNKCGSSLSLAIRMRLAALPPRMSLNTVVGRHPVRFRDLPKRLEVREMSFLFFCRSREMTRCRRKAFSGTKDFLKFPVRARDARRDASLRSVLRPAAALASRALIRASCSEVKPALSRASYGLCHNDPVDSIRMMSGLHSRHQAAKASMLARSVLKSRLSDCSR